MAQKLADFLRKAREDKKFSTRDLAEQVGCSQSLITSVENGRRLPHMVHLWKIVKVLEVDFRPALYYLCLDQGIPANDMTGILPEDQP